MNRNDDINSVTLTDSEIQHALLEAKRKKYFHEQNCSYWEQKEKEAQEREAEYKARIAAKRKLERMKGRVSPALTSI